jgi:AcrR family transcriptional regulator
MIVRRRRAKEKQERHEEILDAAELTFFGKGYEQTSMDDIARAAELSRALLYVYFKDKAAIMRGVMLRAAQSLQRRFEAALAAGETGVAQIEGIGHAYHAFSVDEANYFDVMTSMATFPGPDESDAQLLALDHCRECVKDLMVTALRNGINDGSLSETHIRDPQQTAFYLQGALHGVIMQARGAKSPQTEYPEAGDLIKYTIAMLTNSIEC